jgi:ribosome maturation factor RimP
MKEKTEQIVRELVEPILETYDAFLVEIIARGERNTRIIEIFIDTEKGVDAKIIADINKEVNRRLTSENIIPGTYRVSVSSPGLDRPLRIIRQYKKNVGRELEVHYLFEGQLEKLAGTLVKADDSVFTLKLDENTTKDFNYNTIQKALIKLPW